MTPSVSLRLEDAAAAAELVMSGKSISAVASGHYSAISDYIFRNNLTEQAELVYAFQMPTIVNCSKDEAPFSGSFLPLL